MDHLKRPEDNSTDCMMSASRVKGVQMSYIRGNLVEGDTASIITRPQWPAGDNSCSKSCLWAGDSTYTDLMMLNRTVTPSGGQYNKIKKALIWDIFRRSCQRFERSNAGSKLILPSSKGWCQYKSSYLPISVSLDRHEGRTQRLMDFTEAHRWPSSEISPPVSRKDSKDRKHCIGHDGQGQLKHAHCVTNLWEMEGSLIVIDLRWTGWKEKRPVEWYLKLTWAVATFNR